MIRHGFPCTGRCWVFAGSLVNPSIHTVLSSADDDDTYVATIISSLDFPFVMFCFDLLYSICQITFWNQSTDSKVGKMMWLTAMILCIVPDPFSFLSICFASCTSQDLVMYFFSFWVDSVIGNVSKENEASMLFCRISSFSFPTMRSN